MGKGDLEESLGGTGVILALNQRGEKNLRGVFIYGINVKNVGKAIKRNAYGQKNLSSKNNYGTEK